MVGCRSSYRRGERADYVRTFRTPSRSSEVTAMLDHLPQPYPTLLLPLPSELRNGVRNGHTLSARSPQQPMRYHLPAEARSEATQEGRS